MLGKVVNSDIPLPTATVAAKAGAEISATQSARRKRLRVREPPIVDFAAEGPYLGQSGELT